MTTRILGVLGARGSDTGWETGTGRSKGWTGFCAAEGLSKGCLGDSGCERIISPNKTSLPVRDGPIILWAEVSFTVPAYDFRCKDCRYAFTLLYHSYQDMELAQPSCPRCGSEALNRLIKKVTILTSEDTRLDSLLDPSRLGDFDENDPRAMARVMRGMASELGEDLGPELGEVVDRLEAGESPGSIEESLPDGFGSEMGGTGFSDD